MVMTMTHFIGEPFPKSFSLAVKCKTSLFLCLLISARMHRAQFESKVYQSVSRAAAVS